MMFASSSSLSSLGTVLIIEDDDDLRETQAKYFEALGLKVIHAADGLEGLIKCQNQKFDCIICDIHLPKTNGQRAIELIRATENNGKTPIIVFSGELDKNVVLALKGKIQKAFTKPANMEDVADCVMSQIKK